MTTPEARLLGPITWALATRARAGEERSGDDGLAVQDGDGVLIAVADGLGHGMEAMHASTRAIEEATRHPDDDVITLIRRCHTALRGTRGAVMSVIRIDSTADTLTWIGVGNVSGLVIRADTTLDPPRESLLLRGGVVGYHLPGLAATVLPLLPGDTIVLATDGIDPAFAIDLGPGLGPSALAQRLLARFGSDDDDALALVAQYTRRPEPVP